METNNPSLPEAADVAKEAVYCSSGYGPRLCHRLTSLDFEAGDLRYVIPALNGKRGLAYALDALHQRFNRFTAWLRSKCP